MVKTSAGRKILHKLQATDICMFFSNRNIMCSVHNTLYHITHCNYSKASCSFKKKKPNRPYTRFADHFLWFTVVNIKAKPERIELRKKRLSAHLYSGIFCLKSNSKYSNSVTFFDILYFFIALHLVIQNVTVILQ